MSDEVDKPKFKKTLTLVQAASDKACQDGCCETPNNRLPGDVEQSGHSLEPIEKKANFRTYHIEGMDCSSCAKTIENHLKTVPSVKRVTVNFSTGKAKINTEKARKK